MSRIVLTLMGLLVLSSAAYADQCPTLMKQVDNAFAAVARNQVDVEDAIRHRSAGEAAHAAGDHATAVEEFKFALLALGIKDVFPIDAKLE